jgi:hypothetical protein
LEIECLIIAIIVAIADGIVINLAIFCDLYHGLILFHHLIALLYQQVFELLVLLDKFKYDIHLHIL